MTREEQRQRWNESARRYRERNADLVRLRARKRYDERIRAGLSRIESTPKPGICESCHLDSKRRVVARVGPMSGQLICYRCRNRFYRRRKGTPERIVLTDVQRKRYAADWIAERHSKRRALAITAYGGRCNCCGVTESAFLAVDHVEGGGNAHRRSLSKSGRIVGSSNFYAWLERNRFPAGFQLLCHNCNFAKSHGGCPHRKAA